MSKSDGTVIPSDPLPSFPPGKIIEAIDGIVVHDPYRALEEDTPETLAWQHAQNSRAAEILHQGRFENVRSSLLGYMQASHLQAPKYSDGGWFRLPQGGDGSELILSDLIAGQGIMLKAGAIEQEDRNPPTFAWHQPSPDGRFVAYGGPEGGGLQGGAQLIRLRVMDISSQTDLPIRIPHVTADVAWLPDSSGFYIVSGPGAATENPERRIAFQSLSDGLELSEEPLRGLGFEARLCISPDGRYLAVRTGAREPRADWLLDRQHREWRPFLLHVPAACFGEFLGKHFVALTTWKSPRGRIVSIPILTAGDMATWREVVPESDVVIRGMTLLDEYIVLNELFDGGSRIRIIGLNRTPEFIVPLPSAGSISTYGEIGWFQSLGTPSISVGKGGFAFIESTYSRSPGLYWFDLKTRTLDTIVAPAQDLGGLNVILKRFAGNDGTQIPATLVFGKGSSKPSAAIIFCYGAYNFATVPGWIGVLGPFVEAGGIAIFANLRGGGELGTEWWRSGHHEHKQQSYDDIYTVAEGLIDAGYTTTDQLAILGLSNGGTNVCTALTQRPDLFRAGAALAPQCDLIRYNRDPFSGGVATTGHHQGLHVNSGIWRDRDWGRLRCFKTERRAHFPQSMYPDPLDYSPYHLVRDGVKYPALLLVCGTADVWCPPWHSRKLAARMQAANASARPILIRVWEGAGHDHPMTDRELVAEWLTFLMNELGLPDNDLQTPSVLSVAT